MNIRIAHLFAVATLMLTTSAVQAGMHWDNITAKGCIATGLREYSGVLWDIPGDERHWEDACYRTPAVRGGRPPDYCVVNLNMWGIWRVPDPTCLENPREDARLILDFDLRNAIPNEALRMDLIVEHAAAVGPYTVVPPPERARPNVSIRAGGRSRTRAAFLYEGGHWVVRARAWVTGTNGVERLAVERTIDLDLSYDPVAGGSPLIGLQVRRTATGYVIDRAGI